MSGENNKQAIRRYFATLDQGDEDRFLALIDELVAEDYVCHLAGSTVEGRESLKSHARGALATFGDMHHIVEDEIAEGDTVMTRGRFRAVLKGEFLGVAPSGQRIDCPIMYVQRFAAGKIQEAWLDWDSLLVVARQLGAK